MREDLVAQMERIKAKADEWLGCANSGRGVDAVRRDFDREIDRMRSMCFDAARAVESEELEATRCFEVLRNCVQRLGAPQSEIDAMNDYWVKRKEDLRVVSQKSEPWAQRVGAIESLDGAAPLCAAFRSAVADWRRAVLRQQDVAKAAQQASVAYGDVIRHVSNDESRAESAFKALGIEGIREGYPDPAAWQAWCQRAEAWSSAEGLTRALEELLRPSAALIRAGAAMGLVAEEGGAVVGRILHKPSGIRLVPIQAGEFDMGSLDGSTDEKPVRSVALKRAFWMAETEITQAQYQALMGKLSTKRGIKGGDARLPIYGITWHDATAYCKALSEASVMLNGVGYVFRLPTEAEWEYCCRAGSKLKWSSGDRLTVSQANTAEAGLRQPVRVGSYAPNSWGLYDMHGNVWEWCLDAWDKTVNYPIAGLADPLVTAGEFRVMRGGGWVSSASDCRSANRAASSPTTSDDFGFRVVLAPNVDH